MSNLEKEKKIVVLCTICKAKIPMTAQEFKDHKNLGQYIIRHETDSTLTVMQVGTLCDACLQKPIEQRVIRKKIGEKKLN